MGKSLNVMWGATISVDLGCVCYCVHVSAGLRSFLLETLTWLIENLLEIALVSEAVHYERYKAHFEGRQVFVWNEQTETQRFEQYLFEDQIRRRRTAEIGKNRGKYVFLSERTRRRGKERKNVRKYNRIRRS